MNGTLHVFFGNKKIPINIQIDPQDAGLFVLSFRYYKPLVEEVKCLDRPRKNSFDPQTKCWRIFNNRRNRFALDTLANRGEIKHFDKPIQQMSFTGYWDHQNSMGSAIRTRKRCIIAGEMRTGKTRPALDAIRETATRAWIVSKKTALLGVKREYSKWFSSTGADQVCKVDFFTYDGFRRHVQNLEAASTCVEAISKENIPDFVVFDEMQKLKTPTAQVTNAALTLADWMYELYGPEGHYIVGLSGTPSPKNPGDWWSLCEIIQPGFIRESNRPSFERRYGHFVKREELYGTFMELDKTAGAHGWKQEEIERLYKRMSAIVFVYLKKDCLDLPPTEFEIVELEPSSKVRRVADAITKQETSGAQVRNRLRQLSDGFQYEKEYDEDKNKVVRKGYKFVGSPKLDRLEEDLDRYEDEGRVIIYAGFQGSIDMICKTCTEAGWYVIRIDGRGTEVYPPSDSEDDFVPSVGFCLSEMDRSTNSGAIDKLAFVANPDSGGAGIELSASPVTIYYSNADKGEARMQSQERAQSNNMDKSTGHLVIDYIHLPTDQVIRDQLMAKKDLQAITMGDFVSILGKSM